MKNRQLLNPTLFFRVCLVLLCFLFSSLPLKIIAGYSNDSLVIKMEQVPLLLVLKEIENQSEYTFVFNSGKIDVNQTVSLNVEGMDLNGTLGLLFRETGISYQFRRKHIILKKTSLYQIPPPAHNFTLRGKVTDENNEALTGVNVYLKGTTTGTITDPSGNFSLPVESGQTLVFSFVGYISREIPVNQDTVAMVRLRQDLKKIEELVVIGYGTESKTLLGSSVTTVSGSNLAETPVSSISSALQGRTSGVMVVQNSGTPGAGITVRIRGVSSINAGAEPLYVIDGVPMITENFGQVSFSGQGVNSVSDISAGEIESLSLLKDASASAIYGARASNGVVLITTRRGKESDTRVDFSATQGWQRLAGKLDMLDASAFMEYRNETALNDGGVPVFSRELIENPPVNTDWLSEIFRTAPIQNYELSATGGDARTRYYLSGNYFGQTGIVKGTDYTKAGLRTNLDHQVNRRFNLSASIGISRSKNNRKEGDQSLNGPVPNAISMPPIFPVYNPDGTFNDDGPLANPLSIARYHKNEGYSFRTLGNVTADYKILHNLSFEAKYGLDYINYREHTYDPAITRQGAKYKGLGLETSAEALRSMLSGVMNYKTSIGNKARLDILAGASHESYMRRSMFIRGQDFPSPELEYIASAALIVAANASATDRKLGSWFGRARYNFDNKYLFTLSARYDGSSKFGENRKFGFFPSGDVAWRISQEDFYSEDALVNELKLRIGYGLTGNDQIPDFGYLALYSPGQNYAGLPGVAPGQLPNPDLKWESTSQANFGLNIGFLQNRISLDADYYLKKTVDLLLSRPLPPSSGFTSITSNVGSLENKGFEFTINSRNLTGEFSWETNLNSSFNRNRVTELYNNQAIDNIGRGGNRVQENEPIGIFYGWKSLGVDPTTGDLVFFDKDENGIIDASDRMKIGDPNPIVVGGMTNTLSYKNLSVSIFLQYSYGNDIFNGTRRYIEVMKGIDNQTTAVLRRWRNPGDITDIPRATNADPNGNDRISSRFVEDGSYLKVKNLRIIYDFDPGITKRLGAYKMSLFILGENLYTWTAYSGMDPEVNYAGQDVLRIGTDFFTYPQALTVSIGFSLGF